MPNDAGVSIPTTVWLGIISLIGILITVIGFFLTKFFKGVEEKFDILFKCKRHDENFLTKKFDDYELPDE